MLSEELEKTVVQAIAEAEKKGRHMKHEMAYSPNELYNFTILDGKIVDWSESDIYAPHEYKRLVRDSTCTIEIGGRKQIIIFITKDDRVMQAGGRKALPVYLFATF